jgi:lysozyme family protein
MPLSNDESLEQSLEWLLEEEGGFSNHPADTGGATMYGVTQATYNAWRKSVGRKQQPVRSITKEEAFSLYKSMYWDEAGCDKLPFPINYMVFDAAVNSGPGRAVKWLQEALRVKPDGVIGRKTLAALSEAVEAADGVILYRIIDVRLVFLVDLIKRSPSQIAFLKGWMRRLIRVLLRSAAALGDE